MFKVNIYLKHGQLLPKYFSHRHFLRRTTSRMVLFCIWFQNENVDLNFQFSKKKTIKTKQQIFCYLLNSLFVLCPQSKRNSPPHQSQPFWSMERCGHSLKRVWPSFWSAWFSIKYGVQASVTSLSIETAELSSALESTTATPTGPEGAPNGVLKT